MILRFVILAAALAGCSVPAMPSGMPARSSPPVFVFEYETTIFYRDIRRHYQPITWTHAPSERFVRARAPQSLPGDNFANINCHRLTASGAADCEVFDAAPASAEWKAFALALVKHFHGPSNTAGADMREVMISFHVMFPARPGIGRVCIPPFCQSATLPTSPGAS